MLRKNETRSRASIIAALLLAGSAVAGTIGSHAFVTHESGHEADPGSGITLPPQYRDWPLISVAHEEGNLNDLRAVLGNDAAIHAYRAETLPFPDGTIIARLAWAYTSSKENNEAFGRDQSFVAGAPTNVQLMLKDSKKYASTGGWGFAQFTNGKPAPQAALQACYICHIPAKAHDYVFTRYAP